MSILLIFIDRARGHETAVFNEVGNVPYELCAWLCVCVCVCVGGGGREGYKYCNFSTNLTGTFITECIIHNSMKYKDPTATSLFFSLKFGAPNLKIVF
jgi:hypothetical protein